MADILFVVDSGPQKGLGHLIRSMSLLRELRDNNSVYLISQYGKGTESLLKKTKVKFSLVESINAEKVDDEIEKNKFDIIVTDLRSPSYPLLKYLKKKCGILASIEDYNFGTYPSDYIINGNIYAFKLNYQETAPHSKLLLGPDYLLLNHKYKELNNKKKHINKDIEKILVTFGGNDKNDLTLTVIEGLSNTNLNCDIKVIAPIYKDNIRSEIKSVIPKKFNAEVVDFIDNMPEEIFTSDIILTGGGATLNEAICVGTPSISIPQTDYEHHNTKCLQNSGATIDLGIGKIVKPNEIKESIEELSDNWRKRAAMSIYGKETINGLGSTKVARTLLRGLKEGTI